MPYTQRSTVPKCAWLPLAGHITHKSLCWQLPSIYIYDPPGMKVQVLPRQGLFHSGLSMRLEPSFPQPSPTQVLSRVVGTEKAPSEHFTNAMLKKYSRHNFKLGHLLRSVEWQWQAEAKLHWVQTQKRSMMKHILSGRIQGSLKKQAVKFPNIANSFRLSLT